MKIERTYEKRPSKDGNTPGYAIGEAVLVVPSEGWTLNGNKLSDAAVQHLANFSLQSLQDAYAGAKSQVEAIAFFDKKSDAIIAGTIGVRTGGVSNEQTTMRKLARMVFRRDESADEYKKFNATEKSEQNESLDAMIAANEDGYKAAAVKHMRAEAERAKQMADLLASDLTVDV